MEPLLMGIDIGTSSCKVALFADDGRIIAQDSGEYPVYHPQPGWAEQNPDDWWLGVCKTIRKILEQHSIDAGRIAGIGVAGQSWSSVAIDTDGNVLCNTPIWYDTRASEICKELEHETRGDVFFQCSGNTLQPSYSLPKVIWYQKHRPEMYARIHKVLQSNSYIVYRLTGNATQDLSQGYGFHFFDMRKGRWNDALLSSVKISRDLLPDILPCHAIAGTVTKEAAITCGLREGTPVVAGGLDAACGTLGAGVLRDGETQEQGGQAGGMSICMENYHADPRLILSMHVVPGCWLLQGGTVGGGGVLRWFESELGAAEREVARVNGTNVFMEMDRLASEIPAGAEGVTFLPYMAGERSPIWNPQAEGVLYGLSYQKSRAHMIRAVLEGVAYSLRHNLEAAQEAGATALRLRAMGGAANSRLWTQIKSDITGKPIDVSSSDTATTLGAAILAGVATGIFQSFDDAVKKTVTVTRIHEPNQDVQAIYDEGYEKYKRIYELLSPLMGMQ